MKFQTMNSQRKFIFIASVTGILSGFVPWLTISIFDTSKSINGFHGWGILALLAFVIAAVITLIGNLGVPGKSFLFIVQACGAVALLVVIIEIASTSSSPDRRTGFVDTDVGPGIWMALAAAVAIILVAGLFKSAPDNLKSRFEGFKKSISIPATLFSERDVATAKPYSSTKMIHPEKLEKQVESVSTEEDAGG